MADETKRERASIDLDVPERHFREFLANWQREWFRELVARVYKKKPDLTPKERSRLLTLQDPDEIRKLYDYAKHELAITGQQTRRGHTKTEAYGHKLEFQKLVIKHLARINTLRDLEEIKDFEFYCRKYPGKDTLRGWFNEIAPNHLKRGKPRKPPSSD